MRTNGLAKVAQVALTSELPQATADALTDAARRRHSKPELLAARLIERILGRGSVDGTLRPIPHELIVDDPMTQEHSEAAPAQV